ncbi:MAG: phenylalanine--tRNA ligase subunit beta [Dehalococcoidia bacterium]
MRIPLEWLSDYVDLPMPARELAHRLTMLGLEAEAIEGSDWSGVRVGLVTKVEPHPYADRLRLATVEAGDGEHTVVCGAPNVAAGQKIAYAEIGARLVDGHSGEPMVLKAAKIRGVESVGMVCSERELGISDKHEGILVLPEDAPVGTPLSQYLATSVIETTPTPNRLDHFSVVGTAHEVAAISDQAVRSPGDSYPTDGEPAAELATVEIEDPDLCARYVATIVRGVKVGPSPDWMQRRLTAAGMRPINNVVDITNYVMLEFGQPLHAFDYDKLRGHQVIARRARAGESMITLDGVRRDLDSETVVIADAERPLVIAGIFGGEDAEVSDTTTNVLLEAANFNAVSTRKSVARYGLKTESAVRFERGVSPAMPPTAARRATALFVELCGGIAAPGMIDVYPGRQPMAPVDATDKRLMQVLGVALPRDQVSAVLTGLGFDVERIVDGFRVTPPPWRTDVKMADDVAEEVARIVGYDELPTRTLSGRLPRFEPNERDFREKVRRGLVAAGLQEVITYSMTNLDELKRVLPAGELEVRPPLKLLNPLSSLHELARTTLRASILRTLSGNLRQVQGPVAIFEIAAVYWPRTDDLPEERERAVGAIAGRSLDRWGREAEPVDFFSAKGALESLLAGLHIAAEWSPGKDHALLPGRVAAIKSGEHELGVLGQLDPKIAASFELDEDVFLFELDIETLRLAAPARVVAQPVVRFPTVTRDLALIVDRDIESERIRRILVQNRLVVSARVFDVYEGEGVPAGKKSIAFSVTFQAPDHTLTDEEVDRAQAGIVGRLERELGASLRA